MSASDDTAKGHEFNSLGALVYMSPLFGTAKGYARSHTVFGDGMCHCVVLELRVDEGKRKQSKQKGGVQWTHNPEDVYIVGVWSGHNVGNPVGTEHLRFWDAEDEALPRGARQATVIYFRLDTADSTLHSLHFPLVTLHFTLYTPHSLHSTFYTLQFTVRIYALHHTLHNLHCTLHTLDVRLYIPHFTFYTPRSYI